MKNQFTTDFLVQISSYVWSFRNVYHPWDLISQIKKKPHPSSVLGTISISPTKMQSTLENTKENHVYIHLYMQVILFN